MSTKDCFHGKTFPGKPAKITFGENKDVNSWINFRLYNNSFAPARSFCHGNEYHGIDPNMLSSGHHESWLFHKGCVSLHSCQTAILPHVGTLNSAYWAFSTFQSAFIWAINSLSCSMKFFQLKITLGLALGESWPLLAQPQKNTDVYKRLLPLGRLSQANLQKLPSAKTRM